TGHLRALSPKSCFLETLQNTNFRSERPGRYRTAGSPALTERRPARHLRPNPSPRPMLPGRSRPAMTKHVKITLPDGAEREFAAGTTAAEIAAGISKSLAKSALAARIDGRVADLSEPLQGDATLEILTAKDAATLELIRHDAAHIM